MENKKENPGKANSTPAGGDDRTKWQPIEWVGLILFIAFLACIFFAHEQFSGAFNAMFARAYKMFDFYLFGTSMLGATIVVSIMTGRILERLGFVRTAVHHRAFCREGRMLDIWDYARRWAGPAETV